VVYSQEVLFSPVLESVLVLLFMLRSLVWVSINFRTSAQRLMQDSHQLNASPLHPSVTRSASKIALEAKKEERKEGSIMVAITVLVVSMITFTVQVSATTVERKAERKVDITAVDVSPNAKLFANLDVIHLHSASDRIVVRVIQVRTVSDRIVVLVIHLRVVSVSQALVVRNHHHHPNAILLRTVTTIIAATPRHHRKSQCHQRSTVESTVIK